MMKKLLFLIFICLISAAFVAAEETIIAKNVSWQDRGDIPPEANGIDNTESNIYFNPRINLNYAPVEDEATASAWCRLVPGKGYTSGMGYLNWANPTGSDRAKYVDGKWVLVFGNYTRYYICSGNEEKEVKEEIKPTARLEPQINCDMGCTVNEKCVIQGTRLNLSDKYVYCDIDSEVKEQKAENSQCQNNYECSTNICIDNKCVGSSIIQRFFSWIKKWFK
jgi:hypothetical protein